MNGILQNFDANGGDRAWGIRPGERETTASTIQPKMEERAANRTNGKISKVQRNVFVDYVLCMCLWCVCVCVVSVCISYVSSPLARRPSFLAFISDTAIVV